MCYEHLTIYLPSSLFWVSKYCQQYNGEHFRAYVFVPNYFLLSLRADLYN